MAEPFSERLKRERTRCNLSQEKLAEKLGVSPITIRRWEIGESLPRWYARQAICQWLNVTPEELGWVPGQNADHLVQETSQVQDAVSPSVMSPEPELLSSPPEPQDESPSEASPPAEEPSLLPYHVPPPHVSMIQHVRVTLLGLLDRLKGHPLVSSTRLGPRETAAEQGALPIFFNRRFRKRTVLFAGFILAMVILSTVIIRLYYPAIINPFFHTVPVVNACPTLAKNTSIQPLTSRDIPMVGFDAQHTRFNPYEHLLSPTNVSCLAMDWIGIAGGEIISSPAVVNGVVYVGSGDGKLYAYNAAGCENLPSCSPLWVSNPTGTGVGDSPAIANGVVYVSSNNGRLYAYNAMGCGSKASCPPIWASEPIDASVFSSPAVVNGKIYIGSEDGKLYVFHLRDEAR